MMVPMIETASDPRHPRRLEKKANITGSEGKTDFGRYPQRKLCARAYLLLRLRVL